MTMKEEMAQEIVLFFKRMKTRDVLWMLFNAKLDNVAERMQKNAEALQKWGASTRKDVK